VYAAITVTGTFKKKDPIEDHEEGNRSRIQRSKKISKRI
jgi:hypothetical protein